MKRFFLLIILWFAIFVRAQGINIIPKPVEVKVGKGEFVFDKNTCILAYKTNKYKLQMFLTNF